LIAGILVLRRPTQAELPVRLNLSFDGLIGDAGAVPAPSPDGRNFVFQAFDASGKGSLWVRPLDSETARPLPETEDAHQPFWSADGRWIGFYSQGKLKKVSPSGGNPQTIAELPSLSSASSPAWSARGEIVFAPTNRAPLFRLAESGGPPQPLTQLDSSRAENSHRYQVFLPDGRRFLFLARSGQRENNALYLGSLDSGQTRRLMTVQSNVSYVPPRGGRSGALLFVRDGTLVEQAFDGEKVTGDPTTIVEKVAYSAASVLGAFAVSDDGQVLIFRPATAGPMQLGWFDRKGNAVGALGPPGDYLQPRISPDGSRVLYARPDEQTGNRDVWYIETLRGVTARLTTHPANDWWPVWSPDGQKILFGSDRGGGPANEGYLKNSMEPGSGETPLFDFRGESVPSDWSRSGTWIAFTRPVTGRHNDLWISPLLGERKPFAFLATPFDENIPRFSPDEKWIAYISNESGRYEVYVRPFSGGPAAASGKIQISSNGGDYPAWQRDGRELFFIGGDLKLYSVKTADLGRPGIIPQPSALFTPCRDTGLAGLPMRGTPWVHPYDVSPDGERFLINCGTLSPGRFDVMLHWEKALK
jgi:dipeptidyl aminopeptidase/acylaminoacyl peptidase